MIWVDIVAALVLFFSIIGGLRDGAVKSFFPLLAFIIAIPLAGASYRLLAAILSFLPGEDWENFVAFFVALAIISIVLFFVFLLPKSFIRKAWNKGGLFRLVGGAFNVFNSAIGMVVFALLILAYPLIGWLERAVTDSSILAWLVVHLSFVQAMLPDIFRDAATTVIAGPVLGL